MSIKKKQFARKHAWFMLTIAPVIIAAIVYGVLVAVSGNSCNADIFALGAAGVIGIVAYAGIAIWEIVNS